MKITKEEVEHVAKLARLALSEEEKEKFTRQLGKILEYVDQLQKVDISAVPAIIHSGGMPVKAHWRKDIAEKKNYTQKILANAPQQYQCFFKVKKVIE